MNSDLIIGGRYEIIEEIGKGGMAIVYKAKCLVLNRYVALKVLRPEYRDDSEFVSRFKKEAQSAGGLSHSNIVSIYDVGQMEELNYIVMEYVEGITLKEYIASKGVLGWKEAVDYAAQICSGLEHAHKKGIIHRDIKPQNIIITREGTAKITDFGIAKATNAATIEMGAANMGSVHYFSPEQARGGYVDCKSDIYSLGVILYEMVTGKVPFDGDNLVTIAMQHLENTPVAPSTLNPSVPKSLEAIIGKAMCKDKDDRYEDVTRMLIDLKKVYIGTPVSFEKEEGVTSDTVLIPAIVQKSGGEKVKEKRPMAEKKPAIEEKKRQPKEEIIIKESSKGDKVSVIAGIITAIVLATVLFFTLRYFLFGGGIKEVTLDSFVGMTVSEATKKIEGTKLEIEISGEEKSDEYDVGEIISQEPVADTRVKENAKIKVVVSLGSDELRMPQLSSMKLSDAKNLLSSLNIKYEVREEENTDVEEGYVARQYPSANTKMKKSEMATIYVSKGKAAQVVSVPSLIGMTEDAAKTLLETMGLKLGNVYKEENERPKGTICKQSLRKNLEVVEGTTVDVVISEGKSETTPPQVSEEEPSGEDSSDENKPSIVPVPNTLE